MRGRSGLGDHFGVGTLKYNFNSEYRILILKFGHSYNAYCIMELWNLIKLMEIGIITVWKLKQKNLFKVSMSPKPHVPPA